MCTYIVFVYICSIAMMRKRCETESSNVLIFLHVCHTHYTRITLNKAPIQTCSICTRICINCKWTRIYRNRWKNKNKKKEKHSMRRGVVHLSCPLTMFMFADAKNGLVVNHDKFHSVINYAFRPISSTVSHLFYLECSTVLSTVHPVKFKVIYIYLFLPYSSVIENTFIN